MMRLWDKIARFKREGFEIVVEKSYEDLHPKDCFDETCYDIQQICKDIDRGKYEWFMLRVTVGVGTHILAENYFSGLLYEDATEVLSDGTAEDLIYDALEHARVEATILQGLLKDLLTRPKPATV